MKLREKILIPVCIILFAGMASTTTILLMKSKNEIHMNIVHEMKQVSDMLIRDLDKYQDSALLNAEVFSADPIFSNIFKNDDKAALALAVKNLKEIKKREAEYESICVTDDKGLVIASDNDASIGNITVADREYFKAAMNGHSMRGPISRSKVTGDPIFSTAAPIYSDGVIKGVLFAVIDQTKFNSDYMDPVRIGDEGYAYLVNQEGLILSHPEKDMIMTANQYDYDFGEDVMNLEEGLLQYKYNGVKKTAIVNTSDLSHWKIIINASNSDIYKGVTALLKLSIFIAVFVFILGVVIIVLITRSIVKPIKLSSEYAENIANGDLAFDFDLRLLQSNDESGHLAKSFHQVIEKLNNVIYGVKGAAAEVGKGSLQLSNASERISQGASEQAATSEEVSSSMEEMGASIKQNTQNAIQTSQMAAKAAEDAEAGGLAVQEAVDAMKQIAEKITIVEDISRNTNMLSLNAAIEAARAGEHGKGFAVVAAEVKKLAENSQAAAKEISELAKMSYEKADSAGEKIQAIIPDIKKTAELVNEIQASSMEQNAGAEEVNKVMIQLDQVIQANASTAEESTVMSEQLSNQADSLVEMINYFKVKESVTTDRVSEAKKGQDSSPAALIASVPVTAPLSERHIPNDDFEEF